MKTIFKCIPIILLNFSSLSTFCQSKKQAVLIDPVCNIKVDRYESYDWKYAGKVYSFHSNECRQVFKMNPQQFLLKNCIADMIAIDPVCGMRVNKLESFNKKYHSITYHFCSYDCKETFKWWPDKFINRKCIVPDSLK